MYKFSKNNIKEYNKSRKTKQKHALCKAPFANLYFSRNGDVVACCFNRDFVLGKYPEETPKDIFANSNIKSFRNTLKHNQMPLGCDICVRELTNENYNGVIAKQFDFLSPHKKYPVMMEFELDNTCNLECVMCQGDLSSSIRINREGKKKITTPYDDKFVDYIKPWLKKAKLLRFGGGEPFLIPLYFKIWDIVLHHNPKCKIYVQTNGTIINERILEWLKSGQFQLGVSLDSLNKDRFESIRVNAKFNEVLQNIDEFIDILPVKSQLPSLVISSTVLRENWKDIPELLEFANRKNAQIVFNTVWTPKSHALHSLDSGALFEIIEYYLKHLTSTTNDIEIHNSNMYLGLINQIKDWHILSIKKEKEMINLNALSIKELEACIWEYISTLDENVELISSKISNILSEINQYSNYKMYLETICLFTKRDIVQTLLIDTEQELIFKLENEMSE